jgi:hypothetical protein
MPDIIKDAAIVRMARYHKKQQIQAYEFLGKYAGDSEEEWEYYIDLLSDLDMIHQTYKPISQWRADWTLDNQGEYVYVWSD